MNQSTLTNFKVIKFSSPLNIIDLTVHATLWHPTEATCTNKRVTDCEQRRWGKILLMQSDPPITQYQLPGTVT